MAILVCGGAGYIGSHTVRQLCAAGEEVIIADNFSKGHRAAISPDVKIYECDIRDKDALKKIFAENKIEAVFHFAAFIEAGESVQLPLKYFSNNVYGMQILLEAMTECGVDKIIFSSTAAVYGEPEKIPIDELDATFPVNPYGDSKLIMEIMMRRVSAAQGVRFVSLRYFNACGAIEDGSIGEDHHPESHLIPLILQVPLGKRDHIRRDLHSRLYSRRRLGGRSHLRVEVSARRRRVGLLQSGERQRFFGQRNYRGGSKSYRAENKNRAWVSPRRRPRSIDCLKR